MLEKSLITLFAVVRSQRIFLLILKIFNCTENKNVILIFAESFLLKYLHLFPKNDMIVKYLIMCVMII